MANGDRYGKIAAIGLCLSLCLAAPTTAQSVTQTVIPAATQSVRPRDAWKLVYQQLPELPRSNQYVARDTKQVDPDNTFVGRLISYHLYTKSRPPTLRLDWKQTIADYLGANEDIDPDIYPTQKRLQQNPLEGDRAVIQQLTRPQRDQLIQVLVTTLGGLN
jgi:hypothetical protein